MTLESRIQRAFPGTPIDLFTVYLNPQQTDARHFCTATVNGNAPTYRGILYTPVPIEIDNLEWSGTGTPPRPRFRVADPQAFATMLSLTNRELTGCAVEKLTTFVECLDGMPEADQTAHFPIDRFVVLNKSAHTPGVSLEWTLCTAVEFANIKIPGRVVIRDTCGFNYRRYVGVSPQHPDGFDYSKATCPYAGGAFFDRTGQATTREKDACSKHLENGCVLRFGEGAELPFGAFPGCDIAG